MGQNVTFYAYTAFTTNFIGYTTWPTPPLEGQQQGQLEHCVSAEPDQQSYCFLYFRLSWDPYSYIRILWLMLADKKIAVSKFVPDVLMYFGEW